MMDLLAKAEPMAEPMRAKILGDLRSEVGPKVDKTWDELVAEIAKRTESLEQTDAWRATDVPGAVYLKLGASILAIYRTLEPLFADPRDLLDHLQQALFSAFYADGIEAYLQKRFGVTPDAPDDAWDLVCTNFVRVGEAQFGEAWTYEQGVRDHKRCFVNIRKCGFADFLLAHDARDLLYVICAGDYLWADALEPYGIGFERPTLLAEGSDACRFQFFSTR